MRAVVNGKAYPEGSGKKKMEAKQKAAENAFKSLLGESVDSVRLSIIVDLLHVWIFVFQAFKHKQSTKVIHLLSSWQTPEVPEAPTTPERHSGITQANYVCWLNEYGTKNRLEPKPVESTQCGPNGIMQ